MATEDISPERAELLRLRARVVVVERSALAALELVLRIRPEELSTFLQLTKDRLAVAYDDETFAPDLSDPQERMFVAQEVAP